VEPSDSQRGSITRDQVMPRLLEACPSFTVRWGAIEHDDMHVEETGERLGYSDSWEFAKHPVSLQGQCSTAEMDAVFAVIERLTVDGDQYVRNLAMIGYLEDVQNCAIRDPIVRPEDFERYLGPESTINWHRLNAMWAGEPLPPRPPNDGG
jgi:hypothetical protein